MTAQLTHEVPQATTKETTEPATSTHRGPLRRALRRMRQNVQEMNYAAQRVVELQAPWSVDEQWQSK